MFYVVARRFVLLPIAAARALAGLAEVALESRIRRIREGLRGEALQRAADDDLERAARLLETGLWSFNVPRSQRAKQQALEAARAAEDARAQVLKALRQARAAWAEVRREGGPWDAKSVRQEIQQHFREAQREAERQIREAHRDPPRRPRPPAGPRPAAGRPAVTAVAVLGAGGVGGFVAGALAHAGADVTVVARPETAAALGQTGVRVTSRALGEDFTVAPGWRRRSAIRSTCSSSPPRRRGSGPRWSGSQATPGLVVPLLNGLEHLDAAAGAVRARAGGGGGHPDRVRPALGGRDRADQPGRPGRTWRGGARRRPRPCRPPPRCCATRGSRPGSVTARPR